MTRLPDSTRQELGNSLTLRCADEADTAQLARLAELDSSRLPAPPVLLVLIAGEPRAALSLPDGTVVADPFYRTAELVELLRMRAQQLDRARRPRRSARRARSRRGLRPRTQRVLAASIG